MRESEQERGQTTENATVRDSDVPEEASRRFEDTSKIPEGTPPSHVDTREAARMLGVSQRAVRNLVGQGQLEAKREGEGAARCLVISLASVERLHSERQTPSVGTRV